MKINKPYTNKQYADLAVYCNSNGCHIENRGDWLEAVEDPPPPAPTREDIEAQRKAAYTAEVDPITAHISRLRDEEQTEEMAAEIESLKAERASKVSEIRARLPYPNPTETASVLK